MAKTDNRIGISDMASPRCLMQTRLLPLVVALIAASPLLMPTAHAQEYTRMVERRFDMATASPTVTIDSQFGTVTVTSGDRQVVTVRVELTVEADSREDARRIGEDIAVDVTGTRERVTLRTTFGKTSGSSEKRSMRADVTVSVPKGTRLSVRNRFGATTVSQVMGAVECEAGFGAVTITRCGSVDVRNEFGNTSINGARGETSVVSKNGRVRVWDIQGGRMENRYGDIEISKATAPITVAGQMGSIRATRIAGGSIENAYGSVDVELLPDFSGTIEAHASFGSITSDYDLEPREKRREKSYGPVPQDLIGRVGTGTGSMRIRSNFGDITLRRGN